MNKENYRPSIIIFFEEGTDLKDIEEKKNDILSYTEESIGAIVRRSIYPESMFFPEKVRRRRNDYKIGWFKRKRAKERVHKYKGRIPKIVKKALGSLTPDVKLMIRKLKDTQAYLEGIDNQSIKFKKIYIEAKFANFLAKSKHTELVIKTNFYEEYKFTDDFIKNYKKYFSWREYDVTKAEQMSYLRKHGTIMPKSERENRIKYGFLKPAQIEELNKQKNE